MSSSTSTNPLQNITIRSGRIRIEGLLGIPESPLGVVLFAHGSGSGRFSPRNNFVARYLQEGSLATLLIDLLDPVESEDRHKVFDIDLLADRLLLAKVWLGQDPRTMHLRIGYFGASTGAGAALQAAARDPASIAAVVSRGGRPDLAERYLSKVTAPTLLIVGGDDEPVIEMNREAYARLRCEKELVIVPGATHLFEEPGTLEQVADQAREWFQRYFSSASPRSPQTARKESSR
jgi:putative phosphoribosyl transferase